MFLFSSNCASFLSFLLLSSAVNIRNLDFHIFTHLLGLEVAELVVLADLLFGQLADGHHVVGEELGVRGPSPPQHGGLAHLYLLAVSLLVASDLGVGLSLGLTHLLGLQSAHFLGDGLQRVLAEDRDMVIDIHHIQHWVDSSEQLGVSLWGREGEGTGGEDSQAEKDLHDESGDSRHAASSSATVLAS